MTASTASWPPPELVALRQQRAARSLRGRLRSLFAGSGRVLRLRLAVLAAAIAVPAMAAPEVWQPQSDAPAQAAKAMPFETPGESFPGSAFYYLDDSGYRPLPIESQIHSDAAPGAPDGVGAPAAGPPARALYVVGSPTDEARAQKCLTMAIYYEAATEPDAGQRAVAQVVLNRVAHPSYPDTVCGVVFQGSERHTGCQFTFACDGSLDRKPMAAFWNRASRVARQALDGAVYAPVGLATHYHTVAVHPYWADSLKKVATIGAHIFYRWHGAAGRPGAFNVAYRGHEPLAAPVAPGAAPTTGEESNPVLLARTYEQTHPAVNAAAVPANAIGDATPDYTSAVRAQGGDAQFQGRNLPRAGALSAELQRSGQWLSQPGA